MAVIEKLTLYLKIKNHRKTVKAINDVSKALEKMNKAANECSTALDKLKDCIPLILELGEEK